MSTINGDGVEHVLELEGYRAIIAMACTLGSALAGREIPVPNVRMRARYGSYYWHPRQGHRHGVITISTIDRRDRRFILVHELAHHFAYHLAGGHRGGKQGHGEFFYRCLKAVSELVEQPHDWAKENYKSVRDRARKEGLL